MSQKKKLPSGEPRDESPREGIFPEVEDAIADARSEISDRLLQYLNGLQVFDKTGLLPEDLADALLVAVLRSIAPGGKYPTERGRFWQILDRYNPFSPLEPDEATRVRLAGEFEGLFAAAVNESFEDGFDSALSLELQRLVLKHGEAALEIVSDLILGSRVAAEVAAAALRTVGEMENEATHDARRRLLERGLRCPSHIARDGAVVGLSALRDPQTIPALEAAAAQETYRLLRANTLALAEQLRELQP
jgi:hypothetical protein